MNKRVFLSGIGGIGMANLAVLLQQAGFSVSGSDGSIYEPAATILKNAGIQPLVPYAAANVPLDGTPVIIGNAQSRGHVEVEAALEAGVPLYSFPEFLHREIMQNRHSVVVAGTHGKSTTTACLAHVLREVGLQPGFLVGALPVGFPQGAAFGSSQSPFVVEGDEYDSVFFDKRSKFLHYFPRTLLLGTVEYDHADIFPDPEAMLLAFRRLINLLPANGRLIYAYDCGQTRELAAKAPCPTISVGETAGADWQLLSHHDRLHFKGPKGPDSCDFGIPGRHNRLNGLMSLAAASTLIPDLDNLKRALSGFTGIKRRFEVLYRKSNLVVYDDFAHHPTAIAASLQAVRESHPGSRIIAVFEPRSNSVVRNIFQQQMPAAFLQANQVVIGTIHRAERIPFDQRLNIPAISAELAGHGIPCDQMANQEIPQKLHSLLNSDPAVVIFMSNGSFDGAARAFVAGLP
jgi:UDP-N-acetylmuramate: L-alanyl-gamma-D-glutamyl-meso-diaminopimelate ligase